MSLSVCEIYIFGWDMFVVSINAGTLCGHFVFG